jgi:hypothetical protein
MKVGRPALGSLAGESCMDYQAIDFPGHPSRPRNVINFKR